MDITVITEAAVTITAICVAVFGINAGIAAYRHARKAVH